MADNTIAETIELLPEQTERYKKKNINILGVFKLRRQTTSGKLLSEFSGLAWDKDEEQLYALSDRGYIVTLRPQFIENRPPGITLLNYTFLKDKNGKRLKGNMSDSEGLALANSKNKKKGDTEFLVSFERKPRIIRYNKLGEIISQENINSELDEINNYKGSNKALESLGIHDQFGLI
ncbi:MAG: esterase-like activity of phytase family protein, partial [Proteobacteria bacterium]|nr:esterase-like activity of phytase family protein [Pseudomonadota bacterium]